jgi:hypothetical protein
MDRKEIIRMAREAGLSITTAYGEKPALERFAALVAAAEREACAKLCQEMYWCYDKTEFATAIRARSKQ